MRLYLICLHFTLFWNILTLISISVDSIQIVTKYPVDYSPVDHPITVLYPWDALVKPLN